MSGGYGRSLVWSLAGALLITAGLTGERLGHYTEPLRRSTAGELGPAQRALSAISSEIRRLLADMLFVRIDAYIHESRPIPAAGGAWGVSYLTTLDIVVLYRLITDLDPSFIEVYSMGGNHLFHGLGKQAEAIQFLKEGIERNQGDPHVKELYGQLGILYLNDLNDPARAIPQFKACHDILIQYGEKAEDRRFVYDLPTITSLLVIAHYRLGQMDQARKYLMEGTNLPPDNPIYVALTRAGPAPPVHHTPVARPRPETDSDDADRNERWPAKPHLQIWLEPERLDLIYTTSIAACLAAVVISGIRFTGRRSPWSIPAGLAAGVIAGVARHRLFAVSEARFIDAFLAFTLLVSLVLVMVLRDLLHRGQSQGRRWAERFEEYVDEALSHDPSETRFFEVALLWFQSGYPDKALRALERIGPSQEPFQSRVLFYIALSLLKLKRIDEARRVVSNLSVERMGRHDREQLARAFDENRPLARWRDRMLQLFLTDIHLGGGGKDERADEVADREAQRALLEPAEATLIGSLPGRYRDLTTIERVDGTIVFAAFDRNLGRPVHLRVLDPRVTTPGAVTRFLDTATTMGRMSDPRFPRVYDVSREGLPYYAMEAVSGVPLTHWAADDSIDVVRRIRMLERIAGLCVDLVAGNLTDRVVSPSAILVGPQDGVIVGALDLPEPGVTTAHALVALTREAHGQLLGERVRGASPLIPPVAQRTGDLLASPPLASPEPEEVLLKVHRELLALLKLLDLSDTERDRQRTLRFVAWIDDVHRSRVHALKSKFAVCDRYRGEPRKLVRTFCRVENIEEVARLLDDLQTQIDEQRTALAGIASSLGPLVARLTSADFRTTAARVRTLAGTTSETSSKKLAAPEMDPIPFLESMLELFRTLSVEMGHIVETHELELVGTVRAIVQRSPYAAQVAFRTELTGLCIRVPAPIRFATELGTVLNDLIANAFEAQAKVVNVSLGMTTDAGVARLTVLDDGIGIAAQVIENLPGARVTTKEGGTATGLIGAQCFAQAHGGWLDIHPVEGHGTSVSVLLPLGTGHAAGGRAT